MKRSFDGSFNVISYWVLGLFLCMVGMMAANLMLQLANIVGSLGLLGLSLAALIYSPIAGHLSSHQARHEFANDLPRRVIAVASGLGSMMAWVVFSAAFSGYADPLWDASLGWQLALICTGLGTLLMTFGLCWGYHNCVWVRIRR